MRQCRVVKKNGNRCQNPAKEGFAGFCGLHFPKKSKKPSAPEDSSRKPLRATEVVAIASGLATLANLVVHILKDLLFAQTPPCLAEAAALITSASLIEQDGGLQSTRLSQPDASVCALEQQFQMWFTSLPNEAQFAIYQWLDDEPPPSSSEEKALERRIREALIGTSQA